MGTRSDVIVHRADGKWTRIYCHWDGYPSHHGPILTEHYATQAKAEKLVAPGDLSILDIKCGKPKGHSFEHRAPGHCVYYGRDRNEADTEPRTASTIDEIWPGDDSWTEFTYIFDGGKWWVSSPEAGFEAAVPLTADQR